MLRKKTYFDNLKVTIPQRALKMYPIKQESFCYFDISVKYFKIIIKSARLSNYALREKFGQK